MDNIQDDIALDIENNKTIFLKESDPFLPIIPAPGIQEEPLEERLKTPPATPIHSSHAFLLDNFETGFNLTPPMIKTRRENQQHLGKELPDPHL